MTSVTFKMVTLAVAVILPCTALAALSVVPVDGMRGLGITKEIHDGEKVIFKESSIVWSLEATLATAEGPSARQIMYQDAEQVEGGIKLSGAESDGLSFKESFRMLSPELIERTVTVSALNDMRYYLDFGWHVAVEGDFYSFTGKESESAKYSPGCSGPEFGGGDMQTFPFLGCLADDQLYGIIGDTPGHWRNLSFMGFDRESRSLSLCNGDGSPRRSISIPREVDATSVYRASFDGWQHIEAGETQTWTTWIFASQAQSLYDVQLAAHLALANAKGFNQSGLEAILRNTSYLLLRRNLLRPESDYIFISGVGYGWKQWVSDGFYMSRGLDDPVYDAAAQAAVFYERIDYEDNAQYYLIWSALVKRAGGDLDMRTVERAYNFMRAHEVDGLFVPPRLKPELASFKTYHDQLPYDDDDAPSSNQGFHCGALMAARELGFPVTDEDIAKAKAGFCRMFNADKGYMATSLKQQEHIGQDSLYGEVLTYALFGEKLLPDEMVKKHIETTMRIQSPYGMRVISKANGDLLDGHSGVYVFGGSWFLNDGCVYLDGLIHGMDAGWIDEKLLWRLEKELAVMPAFHESISTVDGHPHGHHLYSWNSGFWWLRREVRARMGMTGPDPLATALDERLGIQRQGDTLVLTPQTATLRPKE